MFTADEARKLAGKSVQEKVNDLLVAIKEAATNKKRQLKTGWEYKQDSDLWVNGGYKPTDEWLQAKAILEKAGFVVGFYYHETQFVDMYTVIKW